MYVQTPGKAAKSTDIQEDEMNRTGHLVMQQTSITSSIRTRQTRGYITTQESARRNPWTVQALSGSKVGLKFPDTRNTPTGDTKIEQIQAHNRTPISRSMRSSSTKRPWQVPCYMTYTMLHTYPSKLKKWSW